MRVGPIYINKVKYGDQTAGSGLYTGDSYPRCRLSKKKRRVLKSLLQRLQNRFNISIAETGYQDYWQRSQIGLAAVCHSFNGTSEIIRQIIDYVERDGQINVISYSVETY